VVDERLSHAFVLEDDILLADDCFKILSSADWIPPEADFVKLNLFPTNSTHTYPVSKPVGLVEGREIRRTAGRIYGTGCYVITEAAARECLEHSGKLSLPVDLFMFDSRFSFATEKKIYTILPGLAVDVGAASTIEGGRNKDRLNACQHLLKGFYSVARRTKLRLLMRKYALSWVRAEFQS
jgi:glycosyl transferase, family 25